MRTALVGLLLVASAARADFIDTSGISTSAGNTTLIADQFAITCWHAPAGSWNGIPVVQVWQIGGADVCLEMLAYAASPGATRYPIYAISTAGPSGNAGNIDGLTVYAPFENVPSNFIVQTGNSIEPVQGGGTGIPGPDPTSLLYIGQNGFQFVIGDSGKPTFAFDGDTQAIIGEHWAANGFISWDASPGFFYQDIQAIVGSYGESITVVGQVPEPSSVATLLAVATTLFVLRRLRRRR